MSSLRVIPRSALLTERYDERTKRVNDHAAEGTPGFGEVSIILEGILDAVTVTSQSQVEPECCC